MKNNISEEFSFIRDRLKEIALLLSNGGSIEAVFMIGCLHSICHENISKFREVDVKEKKDC